VRRRPNSASLARSGYTLIELVMAASLTALAIVPALAVMRDSIELGTSLDSQNMITTLCVAKLEEHLALAAATFDEAKDSGNFSSDGHSELRYTVTRSTAGIDGGIADQLMAVTVTVWNDADSDTNQDADESSLTLASKIAKMAKYQDAAN